jgi:hypothetical protein
MSFEDGSNVEDGLKKKQRTYYLESLLLVMIITLVSAGAFCRSKQEEGPALPPRKKHL